MTAVSVISHAFSINEERVQALASQLRTLGVSPELATEMAPPSDLGDEDLFRAFLWTASICHATKGALAGHFRGRFYKGWDYLLRAFVAAAEESADLVSPEAVEHMDGSALFDLLRRSATETRIGFADLDRRAAMLVTTAGELRERYQGSVERLLAEGAYELGGPDGLYAQLEHLSCFRDSYRKKSTAFLVSVHYSHRAVIRGIQEAEPMVDYHRMRLLLRTGCIDVLSDDVARSLREKQPADDVVESGLRELSHEVSRRLPEIAAVNAFDVDVVLWAHARSCCRNLPLCRSQQYENGSFSRFVLNSSESRCVFADVCPGAHSQEYRDFWEPMRAVEHY